MRKKILIVCTSIGILGLVWFTISFFTSIDRTPKFPINYLAEKQFTIFPSNWKYDTPIILTADNDLTFGKYAYETRFQSPDPRRYFIVTAHMFKNPLQARIEGCPSYSCIGSSYKNDGIYTIPEDWTYRPRHADSFVLKCIDYQPNDIGNCGVTVRYGEISIEFYLIEIYNPSSESAFTTRDLQLLLEVTDEIIYNYFEQSTINPKSKWLIGF